mgnify:CR=1 FL=1
MEYFLQQLINGLTLGAIYGLIAVGYTMVFGIIGMVNFAQGEVMMLIAYTAYSLTTVPGMNFWLLLPCVLVVSVLMGLVIERVFIRPMLGEPMFSRVMVTIGLAVVIRSSVLLIWGVEPTAFPRPLGSEPLRFAGLALYPGRIFALVSLAVLCGLMTLFFARSRITAESAGARTGEL